MIFLTVLRQPHKYFPKYKLISNAFILMGAGLGSVIFGVFNITCMNPLHEKAMESGYFSGDRDYIAKNYPPCWRLMAIVVLLIGSVGTALFYPLVSFNRKEEEIKLQKGEVPDFENSCYSDEEGLKSHVFWVLVLLIVGGTFGNYYLTANFKNYAKGEKEAMLKNEDFLIYTQLTGQLTGAFCR